MKTPKLSRSESLKLRWKNGSFKGTTGRKMSDEEKLKHSIALKGRMPKNLAQINANKKGSGNPMWGKATSQLQKETAGKLSRERWSNPLFKEMMREKFIEMQPKDGDSTSWKGDDATYSSIHKWVRKRFGKADKCELEGCVYPRKIGNGKLLLTPKKFHWANLDHQYRRVREDWMMMCASCHLLYDHKNLKGIRIKL